MGIFGVHDGEQVVGAQLDPDIVVEVVEGILIQAAADRQIGRHRVDIVRAQLGKISHGLGQIIAAEGVHQDELEGIVIIPHQNVDPVVDQVVDVILRRGLVLELAVHVVGSLIALGQGEIGQTPGIKLDGHSRRRRNGIHAVVVGHRVGAFSRPGFLLQFFQRNLQIHCVGQINAQLLLGEIGPQGADCLSRFSRKR